MSDKKEKTVIFNSARARSHLRYLPERIGCSDLDEFRGKNYVILPGYTTKDGWAIKYELTRYIFDQVYFFYAPGAEYVKRRVTKWHKGKNGYFVPIFAAEEYTSGPTVELNVDKPTGYTAVYPVYTSSILSPVSIGSHVADTPVAGQFSVSASGKIEPSKILATLRLPSGWMNDHEAKPIRFEEGNKEVSNQLFVVIAEGEHKGKYVTKLAVDKEGRDVVQLKNGNDIFAIARGGLEEVLPYTVDVQYMNGERGPYTTYSFFAVEGQFSVGDMVLDKRYSTPILVKAINTRSTSAAKWLLGSVFRPATIVEPQPE